ncbi:MAG: shikimate dehydrogenase [Clostridia bacterium]|nr:shikimate dehydrogenase [Clostridia bacterium]
MNDKKVRLGLLGRDVSKSLSEEVHTFILNAWGVDCDYERVSVGAGEFDNAMRYLLGDFDGFNVTIPYKREVMAYLNTLVGDAMDFGSVNTIVTENLTGYNTDGVGFLMMLRMAGILARNKKVLILGGGGAGRSIAKTLKKDGAFVFMYQRRREKLLEVCAELGITPADDPEVGGYDILINCTGVGMHETEGCSPVSAKAFCGASEAIDLIYSPSESEFLRQAREAGLATLNGAGMLFYQAYYADCIFLHRTPDDNEAQKLFVEYRKTKEEKV